MDQQELYLNEKFEGNEVFLKKLKEAEKDKIPVATLATLVALISKIPRKSKEKPLIPSEATLPVKPAKSAPDPLTPKKEPSPSQSPPKPRPPQAATIPVFPAATLSGLAKTDARINLQGGFPQDITAAEEEAAALEIADSSTRTVNGR